MSFAGGFWATVELLVQLDGTSQPRPFFEDDVEDWLENVSNKVKKQLNSDERPSHEDGTSVCDDGVDYGNMIDCSFYHSPVSSRLEQLMGSNIVRLTDRKYMLKLMMRIREDYEARQEVRIQNRKFRELMRTKRLILSRFIPMCEAPPEILEYHLFQLYSYCDKLIERRQKKRKPRKKVEISKSLYQLLYPEFIEDDVEEEEDKEMPTKEIIIDGVVTLIPLTPEELEEIEKDKLLQADIRKGYMHTKDEYENLHYEAEEVKQLKGIESVKEMYEMAHEIIGSLFSIHRQKRKRCLHDQEMLKKMDKEQGIEDDDDDDEDEEGDNDEEEE